LIDAEAAGFRWRRAFSPPPPRHACGECVEASAAMPQSYTASAFFFLCWRAFFFFFFFFRASARLRRAIVDSIFVAALCSPDATPTLVCPPRRRRLSAHDAHVVHDNSYARPRCILTIVCCGSRYASEMLMASGGRCALRAHGATRGRCGVRLFQAERGSRVGRGDR